MSLDGPIDSKKHAQTVGVSLEGCAYRGMVTCLACPFEPPIECDYQCVSKTGEWCPERYRCRCGYDQTERLRAWGLVE